MSLALVSRLSERIARNGPIPLSDFIDTALYDEPDGFYAAGGRAGRRGDFLTSPEVGPLFGAVVANALDTWWDEMGQPDPFIVVDAGAGPGTLARSVLAAAPACSAALRYVLVERSAAQRALHGRGLPLVPAAEAQIFADPTDDEGVGALERGRGPLVVSLADMPAGPFVGVILANELLDNLAFDLLVYDGGWRQAVVAADGDRFVELLVPLVVAPSGVPAQAPHGSRVAMQDRGARWLRDALDRLECGRVVVVDYTSSSAVMAATPYRQWLRTFRAHERGGHYLADPGSQDITCDVAVDQLAAVRAPDAVRTQAQFLQLHGIPELVADGRRIWAERAHIGDLPALRARSRISEADALLDPAGLGGFSVIEWQVGS